ncbi:ABC transporter permease [Fictibacillus iocasae]|uniref:ABC transporter permease n=1 Tax=Fictibacillus iocasae TaxID=2715437 RepID=A0ABW2NHX3_9BACL
MKKRWSALWLLFFILIVWDAVGRWTQVPAWLLPSPLKIFSAGLEDWSRFYVHVLSTASLSFVGFLTGTTAGLLAAILLHRVPALRQPLYPFIILSQNVPVIVLAPLLVIWFGFGLLPKIIVITLVCFFPVTIAALDGFKQTDRELVHYFTMCGASKSQMFWKLEMPHSLPSIFSGLKIAATYSVMGAVISEWLGSERGIGVYMTLASSSFRTDRVFVAIFSIMMLSLLFFFIIVLLERRMVAHQRKELG